MQRLPFSWVNLVGDCISRNVTLCWPKEQVRALLPVGLELGEQSLTPPNTHPVCMFFNDALRVHLTIPNLLPNMTYHEHVLGIPYVYTNKAAPLSNHYGPYFFMPRLLLNDYWAWLGGRLLWGYQKVLAKASVTANNYQMMNEKGQPLVSLDFRADGEYQDVWSMPNFEPVRQMLDQVMLSQLPLGTGPLSVVTRFDKQWSVAKIRPISTVVRVEQAYYPGMPCGRFPAEGRMVGLNQTPLGSYEILSPWRLTIPYPGMFVSPLENNR